MIRTKCHHCGDRIWKHRSKIRRSEGRVYCSRECRSKHSRQSSKGALAKLSADKVITQMKTCKKGRSTSQQIGKVIGMGTYEVSSRLKSLEKQGIVYKVYPPTGSCIWGLMSHFRCVHCNTSRNPSETEFDTCVNCTTAEADFQINWAKKKLTNNPPDLPVWIYAG